MVRQVRWPRPLDNVLCPLALHDNLVTEPAGLGQDLEIQPQRIGQISRIHYRGCLRVLPRQAHRSTRARAEKFSNHAKGVFVVHRKISVLLWSAVALRVEEFDVGLLWGQTHGVPAGFSGRRLPDFGVGQAIIETSVGEGAEREGGEEALLLVFPELVALCESVAVVSEMVGGKAGLFGFVEHEDNLRQRS